MTGRVAGSVGVSVVPNAEGWNREAEAQLLPQANELGEKIGKILKERIEEELAGTSFSIDAHEEQPDAVINHLNARLDELDAREVSPDITVHPEEPVSGLEEINAALDETAVSAGNLAESTKSARDQLAEMGITVSGALTSVEALKEASDNAAAAMGDLRQNERRIMEEILAADPLIDEQTASLMAQADAAAAAGIAWDEYGASVRASRDPLVNQGEALNYLLGELTMAATGEQFLVTKTGSGAVQINNPYDAYDNSLRKLRTNVAALTAEIQTAGVIADESFIGAKAALDRYRDDMMELALIMSGVDEEMAGLDVEAAASLADVGAAGDSAAVGLAAAGAGGEGAAAGIGSADAAATAANPAVLALAAGITILVVALAPVATAFAGSAASLVAFIALAPGLRTLLQALTATGSVRKTANNSLTAPIEQAVTEFRQLRSELSSDTGLKSAFINDAILAFHDLDKLLVDLIPLGRAGAASVHEILGAFDRTVSSQNFMSFLNQLAREAPADTEAMLKVVGAVGGDLEEILRALGPQAASDTKAIADFLTQAGPPLAFTLTVAASALHGFWEGFQPIESAAKAVLGPILSLVGGIHGLFRMIEGGAAILGTLLGGPIAWAAALGIEFHKMIDPGHKAASAIHQVGTSSASSANTIASSQPVLSKYQQDMLNAANDALTLANRVTNLTNALNIQGGATATALGDIATFHQGLMTLEGDMTASGDKAGYLTKNQLATASALASLYQQAVAASGGILQTTKSAGQASGPLEEMRTELEKIKDPTRAERELLHELNKEINDLHSKSIDIGLHVFAQSSGNITYAHPVSGGLMFSASGAVVPGRDMGHDSVHAMVRPEESIMVPEFTRAHGAAQIMRWNREYAAGRNTPVTAGFGSGGIVASQATSFAGGDTFQVFLQLLGPDSIRNVAQGGPQQADQIAQRFASGGLTTPGAIAAAEHEAILALTEFYRGPHRKELENIIREQTGVLAIMAKAQQDIGRRIAAEKLFSFQEAQSLQSFSALSSQATALGPGGQPAPTAQGIENALSKDLAQLRRFYDLIGRLKRAGVAVSLIDEVEQMGPANGIIYAEAILRGGGSLIREIDRTEKLIHGEDIAIGHRAAEIQFGQSITEGFLRSLEKDNARVKQRMHELGDEIAREILAALHGKLIVGGGSLSALDRSAARGISTLEGIIGSGDLSQADIRQLESSLRRIGVEEHHHMTHQQGQKIIALLEKSPRNTGAAAGAAIASALNGVSRDAAAAARFAVRPHNR